MTKLQATKLKELKGNFSGAILLPGDKAYESARQIWNAMIDKHPALILRCATTSDVVRAVNFARDNKFILAVRGGGHNIAGNAMCDDGVVIDLSQMKATRVDPDARRVTIEGGATLADLDAATQIHGLATPLGINSTTGVAGLTLGGGFGWLSRKYGMTIDNLESAEVVTAAGEVVRANATEHPDLFSGPQRRQWEFRRCHPLRVPTASGRPRRTERSDRLPDLGGEVGGAAVPPIHRQGTGGALRVAGLARGAASAVPPSRGPR